MKNKLKIQIIGIAIIALVLLIGKFFVEPAKLPLTYISIFGFLALLSILFVLLIPIIIKFKRNRFTAVLLANLRWIGIFSFIFALIHVILVYHFFFSWNFAKAAENVYRNLGLAAILILAALAVTSNNFAVRLLKRNWKRLHYLVYVALVLVIIHSFNLGKIFLANRFIQVIIALIILIIFLLKIKNKIKINIEKDTLKEDKEDSESEQTKLKESDEEEEETSEEKV